MPSQPKPPRGASKSPPAAPAPAPTPAEATRSFVKDLVERGEAVVPQADGSLPGSATHEIVGREPDGSPIVRRRRFSTY